VTQDSEQIRYLSGPCRASADAVIVIKGALPYTRLGSMTVFGAEGWEGATHSLFREALRPLVWTVHGQPLGMEHQRWLLRVGSVETRPLWEPGSLSRSRLTVTTAAVLSLGRTRLVGPLMMPTGT
jgi:hypothetical protein